MREIRLNDDGYISFHEDGKEIGGFGTADYWPDRKQDALCDYSDLIADWRSGVLSKEQLGVEIKGICEG